MQIMITLNSNKKKTPFVYSQYLQARDSNWSRLKGCIYREHFLVKMSRKWNFVKSKTKIQKLYIFSIALKILRDDSIFAMKMTQYDLKVKTNHSSKFANALHKALKINMLLTVVNTHFNYIRTFTFKPSVCISTLVLVKASRSPFF
jgi:hypothetical protein